MANDTDRMTRTVSGFIITPPTIDPLNAAGELDVRYAARFDDGRGLIAFLDADPATAHALTRFGQILTEVEPNPDDPRTWPDWTKGRPAGPKRQVARGDERFILYEPVLISAFRLSAMFDHEYDPRGVAVVFDGIDLQPLVLVETGPEWRYLGSRCWWDATVVKCWDQGWR